jgi:hypothetical protein
VPYKAYHLVIRQQCIETHQYTTFTAERVK